MPFVLHATGVIPVVLIRSARPWTKFPDPAHRACGVVAAQRLPTDQNFQPRACRNLCCRFATDCEHAIANGSNLREYRTNQTLSSARTGDSRTEAGRAAPFLCNPAMASDHPTNIDDTRPGTPRSPARGQQRPSQREVTWTHTVLPRVLYGASGAIRWRPRVTPRVHSSEPNGRPSEGTGRRSLLLRVCEVSSSSAADRRPLSCADDGRLPSDRWNRPSDRTGSGTTVSRYEHIQSAPVVEWGPPAVRAALC